jgi:acyl-coenzyme A thioesterase 13
MRSVLRPSRLFCSTRGEAFIDKAKRLNDSKALLGPFVSAGRFDACLETAGMIITDISEAGAVCEVVVSKALTNNYGTLHGGVIAMLVDVVGTIALLGRDPSRAGVSIDMNQTFMSAARPGDRIVALGSVVKYGGRLGFTHVELRRGSASGPLLASGRHTKMFT